MESLRLFVAVNLPDDYKNLLKTFREAHSDWGFRWIGEENWHLTILFIGEVPKPFVEPLQTRLKHFFLESSPFKLHPYGYAFAPKERHARMVWLTFLHADPFQSLVDNLFDEVAGFMEKQGQALEQSRPKIARPHVTLARFKPFDARSFNLIQKPGRASFSPLLVNECVLMASVRQQEGAVYTALAHFQLASGS